MKRNGVRRELGYEEKWGMKRYGGGEMQSNESADITNVQHAV